MVTFENFFFAIIFNLFLLNVMLKTFFCFWIDLVYKESNCYKIVTIVNIIFFQTLMEAWKDNCLNDEYFLGWLDEMAIELTTLEESVAPDGWKCQWDKYVTYNLLRFMPNEMFHYQRTENYIVFYLIIHLGGGIYIY